MITIQSGKMTIPEEDRFVGFAGDNSGNSKTFVIPGRGNDSGVFSLCLRFDDDSVRVIELTKSLIGSDLNLIWQIRSEHLLKSGIVMAQVKSVDPFNTVRHSTCDYFLVADGAGPDEDTGASYVTREEIEERLSAFTDRVSGHTPYIGEDDYWYLYDASADTFVRSVKAIPDIAVDSAMIPGSTNPVQSCAIKSFVESGLDEKVSKTTRVAGLALSGDILPSALAESLSGIINPPQVSPDHTVGYGGQYGKTFAGDPVMCVAGTTWVKLATDSGLSQKMELAPSVNFLDIDSLTAGQLFTCQSSVALKTAAGYIELAKKENVYSKTEINSMIGDIETLLSCV